MNLMEMSFTGGVMILAVLLVRALFLYRLPKRIFLLLWLMVILRLTLPFSIPSPYSVYAVLGIGESQDAGVADEKLNGESFKEEEISVKGIADDFSGRDSEEIMAKTGIFSLPSVIEKWVQPLSLWEILRALGTLVCGLVFFIIYYRCAREFRMSMPVEDEFPGKWLEEHRLRRKIGIRQSDRVETPITYGLIFPVILFPRNIDWEEEGLNFILEHEWLHIRRFDNLFKLALTGVVCLHWFNPLVWVMYLVCNRDIELSCDEAVMRSLGEEKRAEYAMTLIRMEEKRNRMVPFSSAFGRNVMKERIGGIMRVRKITFITGVLGLFLVGGITTAFATSAPFVSDGTKEKTTVGNEAMEEYEILLGGLRYEIDSLELKISSVMTPQIAEIEAVLEQGNGDEEELFWELESLKESKYAEMIRLEQMREMEMLLADYGPWGISVDMEDSDWDNCRLYYDSQLVRYLVDEGAEEGPVLWSEPQNGGLIAEVLRNEDGEIIDIETTEAS